MKNPVLIRGDHNLIGQLMGEFHERDYKVDGGRGTGYLRYASDPLAFPFMQKVRFQRRQSPLKVYEEASCFRNEQEGEVSGLKRVRGFTMTDMHAACSSPDEAQREFEALCFRFAGLMNDITAPGRWVLGWEGTIDFFETNKAWLVNIGKKIQVPAFFKLMPQMSHYYAIKNEYQFIAQDKSNIQVSTVQWDVKDGERFDIGYLDEDSRKHPCPVIIHASSFGSIERTLCSILENIALDIDQGKTALYPFWLSPTQVRIIPVADSFLDYAQDLRSLISAGDLRVDIDDRDATVGKKIRDGEKEWVQYLLVVGEKEQSGGYLTVRDRENKNQLSMKVAEFIGLARQKQGNKPFRPLPLPSLVSQRPLFH
jgi:threonyl-tRNA synthetase